ncbi:MAG: hypothetical protein QGH51_02115 [Planctomycetota bacterium]|nr:hypothetical protein [Planctomycetota bacterium]MDP6940797.1 hypothetical protein [Planctomycetota bacterium]
MFYTSSSRLFRFSKQFAFGCCIVFLTAFPAYSQAQTPPLDAPQAQDWESHGYWNARYRVKNRSDSVGRDKDLILSVRYDFSKPSTATAMSFDGVLFADFDSSDDGGDLFHSLGDTWSNSTHGFIYNAWFKKEDLLGTTDFRFGRQELHRGDALWFDGIRADLEASPDLNLLVYGGTPVHFYEDESSSDDGVFGAGLDYRASRKLRLRLDGMNTRDSYSRLDGETGTARNELAVLSGTWLPQPGVLFRGSASAVDGKSRRQDLSFQWSQPSKDWWARVRIRHQNDYGEMLANEIAPYSAVLGDVAPYWEYQGELHRRLSDSTDVLIGWHSRTLENQEDEGLYNREFKRWFVGANQPEVFGEGTRAGIRGDVWDSEGASSIVAGANMAWDYNDETELSCGTDYSKYRFDVFTGLEYLDDRRYWAKAKIKMNNGRRLRLRYSRDRSQLGNDHLFEVSMGVEF